MLSRSVCAKCWGGMWASAKDSSWICKLLYTEHININGYSAGCPESVEIELSGDPPKICPFVFQHALSVPQESYYAE